MYKHLMLTGAQILTYDHDLWRGSNSNVTGVVDDYGLTVLIGICKLLFNNFINKFVFIIFFKTERDWSSPVEVYWSFSPEPWCTFFTPPPPPILHTVTVVSNPSWALQSSQEKSRKSFVTIETGKRRALITKLWKKVFIDLVINQRIL